MVEQEDEALCFYINAWESEYFNNPFLTILYELINSFEETSEKITKLKDAGVEIQKTFSFQASAVIVSAGGGYQEKTIDIFKDYTYQKNKLKFFITELEKLQKKIDKPIIFFIDELDRCNPEYAIKTLEILKHFFNVEGIKFVLSIDREQIKNVLKIKYGIEKEENINGFLRKIIDVDFYLPEPSHEKYSKFLYEEVYKIKDFMEDIEQKGQGFCFVEWKSQPKMNNFYTTGNKDSIHEFIDCLCKDLNISLRELEKIYFNLNVILKTSRLGTFFLILDIVIFFIFIKYSNKTNYENLKTNEYHLNDPKLINTNLKFKDNNNAIAELLTCFLKKQYNHNTLNKNNYLFRFLNVKYSISGIPPFMEYFKMIDLTEEIINTETTTR